MMKWFTPHLLVAAMVVPQAGQAGPVEPLLRIFPEDSFRSEARDDIFAEGVRTYSDVTVRGGKVDVGIDEMTLRALPGGDLSIHFGSMTFRPRDPAAPAASLSGVTVQLRDWPETGAPDGVCAWFDVIEKLNVSGAEVKFAAIPPAIVSSMRLEGLGFEARGHSEGCWGRGLVAINGADVYHTDGTSVRIAQLRAEMSVPADRATAARPGDGKAGLRAKISEIQLHNAGNMPAVGLSKVDANANFSPRSLEGLLHVIRGSDFFTSTANGQLNLMQMINAMTLIEGDIEISAPVTRIHSAGVVPPEAVTNFSRVGLSTVTGSSGLNVEMKRGDIGVQAKTSLVGLVDLDAELDLALKPYARKKLLAAKAGKDLGAHLLPEVSVKSGKLDYDDEGLEAYVLDLTGVPSGRYIEEFAALLAEQQSERIARTMVQAASHVSSFFRFAAQDYGMNISLDPEDPVQLAELILLSLTDIRALAERLRLEQSRRPPKLTSSPP